MPDDILLYLNEIITVHRGTSTTNLIVVPISMDEYNRLMSKPYKRPLKNQAWRLITSGAANSYTYTDYAAIAAILNGVNPETSAQTFFNAINGRTLTYSAPNLKADGMYITASGELAENTTGALNVNSVASSIQGNINKSVSTSSTILEVIPGVNDTITNYIVRYVSRPTPIILENLKDEKLSIGGFYEAMTCALDPILHQEILQRAVELAKAAYTGDLNSQLALGVNSQTNLGMVASK